MSFEDDKKYRYRNLSGNTAIEITEDFGYYTPMFDHLCLANVHDTDSVNVDLYQQIISRSIYRAEWLDKGHVNNDYTEPADQTETYYYMKNVTIPAGVTLQLTNKDFHLDPTMRTYIKLSAGTSVVDLSIKGPISKNVGNEWLTRQNYKFYERDNLPIRGDRSHDDKAAADGIVEIYDK